MEPLIKGGDWVEVRSDEPARVGSVVLARSGSGELVCHRVLACAGDTLRLAGDRSLRAEEHAQDSLLGIVRSIERGDSTWRLGGGWTRRLDVMMVGLHRLSLRWRGLLAGRALETLRRLLLAAYAALTPKGQRNAWSAT